MSDLLAEVDEAMRYERIEEFWKKYGTLVVAAIVLIIGTTATISFYQHWNQGVKLEQTEQVLTLVDGQNFPQNVNPEALDMRPSLKAIVLLRAGEAYLIDEDQENANAMFAAVIADPAIDQDFKQIAQINTAKLVPFAEADTDALSQIMNDKNSPWRYHAALELALVQAGQNDYLAALDSVNIVLDANVPETIRSRAQSLAHVYGLQTPKIEEGQGS